MKKLTLLLFPLLGVSAAQASGLMEPAKQPPLTTPARATIARHAGLHRAPTARLSGTPTGYIGSTEMIAGGGAPHPYRAENVTISQATYFRFSYYGPYGQDAPVNVDVISTNANAQLTTGFDGAPYVWQITFDPSVVDANDDAEAVISVSDSYGNTTEYVITWPRTSWY